MGTGDKYTNIATKRLMGTESFKDYFLDYLNGAFVDLFARVYSADGTYGPTKCAISASGNDEFDLADAFSGTDGSGHELTTDTTYCQDVQFENTSAIDYDIALKYAIKPSGVQINARTGYPEYLRWEETWGESGVPTSVVDNGTDITFNINSIIDNNRTQLNRKCLVWKNTPALGAVTEGIAIEECTVAFSGGNNTITTSALLGQTTVSTTAADYTVLLLGPTVTRQSELDLEAATGYWYMGYITGAGSGSPPTIPGDSNSNQRLIENSLSDLFTSYTSELEFRKSCALNWDVWDNSENTYKTIHAVAAGRGVSTGMLPVWWVAVGIDDTSDAHIYVSRDAKVWEERSNPKAYDLRGVVYDDTIGDPTVRWVAVGAWDGSDPYIVTSGDTYPMTWTERACATTGGGTPSLLAVATNGTIFCAVGGVDGAGETIIHTSSNGTAWVERTNATVTNALTCIAWNGSLFCAGGDTGAAPYIVTSADGISWTVQTPAATLTEGIRDICWNGTVFCAVGLDGEIQTSTDGVAWVERRDAQPNEDFESIAADDSGMMIAGTTQGKLMISTDDGVTWEDFYEPQALASSGSEQIFFIEDIHFAFGRWVMTGYAPGGNGYIFASQQHAL